MTEFHSVSHALANVYDQSRKRPPDPGLLATLDGDAFFAGTGLIASSDSVRATLEVPSAAAIGAVIFRLIVSHDQSGVLPFEFIRQPDTNLPTTVYGSLSTNMATDAPVAESVMKVDSGLAMTGAEGGAFLPATGSVPNDLQLQTPLVVRPGRIVGLNADVGATLTSGSATVLVLWLELPTEQLDSLAQLAAT